MNYSLGPEFRRRIENAYKKLSGFPQEQCEQRLREGGWTKKEILGHLIDSALNNHQRFVRASLQASYEGPGYEQKGWVDMHGYGSMPWQKVLAHWQAQNDLLCDVVDRIPEEHLPTPCHVGQYEPATLQFVVEDYLDHMDMHVRQITD